jgi:predicted RND superfamily exporter protein
MWPAIILLLVIALCALMIGVLQSLEGTPSPDVPYPFEEEEMSDFEKKVDELGNTLPNSMVISQMQQSWLLAAVYLKLEEIEEKLDKLSS